jgi:hypothetical protein
MTATPSYNQHSEVPFMQLNTASDVKPGTAVILKVEARRLAVCPFAAMMVEKILFLDPANTRCEYVLVRPYVALDAAGNIRYLHERLTIVGFERLAESFFAFNHGDNAPYVMSTRD